MAVDIAAPLITEVAKDAETHVGDASHRRPVAEVRVYRVDVPYAPLPRRYGLVGDVWADFCGRCGGKGNVGYGLYGGVCFGCNGSGLGSIRHSEQELAASLKRWVRKAVKDSAVAAARVAEATAARAAWREANADLVRWAEGLTPTSVEEVDGHTQVAETREEAETPERPGLRFVRSQPYEPGGWWALFAVQEERFEGFGPKAPHMIRRVRAGAALDARDTAYLRRVRESAEREAAELGPKIAASRHAAAPGTRMAITGRVALVRELGDDGYGARRMVVTEGTGADAGVTWVAFSSADSVWRVAQGDMVSLRATVQRPDTYRGVRRDIVSRPVFTAPPAAVAPQAAEPVEAAAVAPAPAARKAAAAPRRGGQRPVQGPACVPGWGLLYDKPKAAAQVARDDEGAYALLCTKHHTVYPLARLSDEGAVRKAGGWCPECTAS